MFFFPDWNTGDKYGYGRYGGGMLPGSLTPPDKLNGDHCSPSLGSLPPSHWSGTAPLAISSMAGPMQTPPSSPPMAIDRFG